MRIGSALAPSCLHGKSIQPLGFKNHNRHHSMTIRGDFSPLPSFHRTLYTARGQQCPPMRANSGESGMFSTILQMMSPKKGKKTNEKAIVDEILQIIAKTNRGTTTSNKDLKELTQRFDELEELSCTYDKNLLNGTWKLLWTTEKEILFIIKEKGLAEFCGTTAGEVYQVIDLSRSRLQNCIEFPPEGSFVVDSDITFDPESRKCSFEFRGARLNLPGERSISLPPLGKSRFKTLFVSRSHRIALDDRGDYLIVERVGPPTTEF